jgi:predicted NAD-dependent protein-ADP-ribosyltransferase YbiA (DUF1768 family)
MATNDEYGDGVYVYDVNEKPIVYYGRGSKSPVSKFHKRQFQYKGNSYNSIQEGLSALPKRFLFHKSPKTENMTWADYEVSELRNMLLEKFTQNQDLKECLIKTGNANLGLTEDSASGKEDLHFAMSFGSMAHLAKQPEIWHQYGDNFIGKLLMSIREDLNPLGLYR